MRPLEDPIAFIDRRSGAAPLLPQTAITGMSTFAAWVRFSMSRRPRPTDSAVESRLTDCEHSPFAVHGAPTLPTEQKPAVQTPVTEVTLWPELG